MKEAIRDNVLEARRRIEEACARSGRKPQDITIVGVTKTCPPEVVDALVEAGIGDIGESRIQEFQRKKPLVTRPCRWHLVGTLQRNKARKAIGEFELIHSVDSLDLARTLSRLGVELGVETRILLEVNTSGEPTKHGFSPEGVVDAAGEIADLPKVVLEGLMTVGPLTDDVARVRRAFASLRELRERIARSLGKPLAHLSMGMSDDFDVAVEEGATIVRLGRCLVGERPPVRPEKTGPE